MPAKKTYSKSKSSKGKVAQTAKVTKKAAPVKTKMSKPRLANLFKPTAKPMGVRYTKRDLTRFVKWPRLVRVQRQRRVLYKRLKTPPAINQFTLTAHANTAKNLFTLLQKIKPEDAKAKKDRLAAEASGKASKAASKPVFVKHGINFVTSLVEKKKAKLVVIAHDVDPIEVVVWLPALCRKMDVPYMIVKGKSRLGQIVNQKTCCVLAITEVNKGDQATLNSLIEAARDDFNNNEHARRTWGGGILGSKSMAVIQKRERAVAAEERKKAKMGI